MGFQVELAIIAITAILIMVLLGILGLHDGRHLHT
ncbi:hypothetical protein LROSRS0_1907 [Furfurilactobacillus rossiae]|jgi:hypothetical protein|nr:hypothetical protein LROSRS0_1907 [Furfurilactobacillus rossiae]QLE67024.1 hypothetical protein LROSL2_1674 [Furfurilactobacillus rossiae]QLE69454.1 hypothetical protein LROSL3_1675 [Furfurilactobacillus rossiae]